MKIEHVCLNVQDLESEKAFYVTYFGFVANQKYTNPKSGWSNYFLSSPTGGARLELLCHADVKPNDSPLFRGGLIHLSVALGSKEAVVLLTERLRQDGYTVFSEPRQTGDGYFESGVLDPEGNRLELTI